MRAARSFRCVGLLIVCVSIVFVLWVQLGFAQADPFVGTWVLNTLKSRFLLGSLPPKEQTVIYEAVGQGLKVSAKGTDAAGKPTLTEYTANYDGRDYPVTGNPDWDAISLKRGDSFTVQFTRKRAGKVVQTGSNVVSRDGKARTITATGVNAQGQNIKTVGIYDKK